MSKARSICIASLSLFAAVTLGGEGTGSGVSASYQRLDAIYRQLSELAADHPELVHEQSLGTTYENRPVVAITIGDAGGPKPRLLLVCGQHARAWISPAVCMGVAEQYVEDYDKKPEVKAVVDAFPIDIIPVLNPDGYEYSFTTDRMWGKNRRRPPGNARPSCEEGVELGCNYAYDWGGVGCSADPCDDAYRGPAAFSEPETKALRDFVMSRRGNIEASIYFTSYSQMITYPFSDRRHSYPADKDELVTVAKKMSGAMKSLYGAQFQVGTAADILDEGSGTLTDWLKGVAGVKYVYEILLRPDESDERYGYELPASFIAPSTVEARAAIDTLLGHMRDQR